MRAFLVAVALAVVGLGPGTQPVTAAISSPFAVSETQPIAPGVVHRRGALTGAAGRAEVNLVKVDPGSDSIGFRTTHALDRVNAREQPTSQALRHSREGHRIIASINGSNFSAPADLPYQAISLTISNGELTSAGFRNTGEQLVAFGIDRDGRAFAGAPRVRIAATLPGGRTAPIGRLNQRLVGEDAVLFTPRYDTSTKTTGAELEVVISGVELPLRPSGRYSGTVSEVRLGLGDAPLAPDSLVISANGVAAQPFSSLAVGDALTVEVSIDEPWQNVVQAVGGRELLLKDGAINIFPTNGRKFATPHPRSAVGVTASGEILMVAVDGRQTHTRGLTIPEMAELMRDLGAVDAINLDGGGSTVLSARTPGSVEASIVNKPSGGIERTVNNAFHVVSTASTGPLANVVVMPSRTTLKEGESRQLVLGGHDAAYSGIVPDVGPVTWSTSSQAVSIDAAGLLTALAPGTATVNAVAGSWSASSAVTVVPDTGELIVSPPEVTLVAGVISAKRKTRLNVSWLATNAKAAVTTVELQARVNGGSWRSVALPSAAPSGVTRLFRFGALHQLRVRATDAAGNRSAWVAGLPFRLVAYNVTHPSVERVGAWRTVWASTAIGARLARSRAAGATLRLINAADQFAVVAQRGPRGGTAQVGFEGDDVAIVNLRAATTTSRAVAWVGDAPDNEDALTALAITNTSTVWRSRLDIDAVIVLLLNPAGGS